MAHIRGVPLVWAALAALACAAPAWGEGVPPSLRAGLSPSQMTVRRACPPAAPGHAACQAQLLALRASGRPIHPVVRPQRALAAFARNTASSRRSAPADAAPGPGSTGRAAPADAARKPGSTGRSAPADAAAQPLPEAGTPAWLQQAYDLGYLSATSGGGDTVAIVDAFDDPSAEADLAVFRSTYGLPACTTANGCFSKVNETGQPSPLPPASSSSDDWQVEEALDLEAVSALCPNCRLLLVEADSDSEVDLQAAMQAAVALGANQISDSWSAISTRAPSYTDSWPGVTVNAATGDGGYLDPAGGDAYPAALPAVTAVGGTTLAPTADSAPRGFEETAWAGAGSGCDTGEAQPAWQASGACAGRAYADVSADADPASGLLVYQSGDPSGWNGWFLAGGTSLATPLTAAYEALTGLGGQTPNWAYANAAWLNDPSSGTNGTCALAYLCTAQLGYDGPTGAGSISGMVIAGGPGIGAPIAAGGTSYVTAVSATSATLSAGIYPNWLDTTYWWQYGPTTAYGQQTAAADAGSGAGPFPVANALSGLSPSTTYHYRLVAQNSAGTAYGYDCTFTTSPAPVEAPGPPTVIGGPVGSRAPAHAAPPSRARAARHRSRHSGRHHHRHRRRHGRRRHRHRRPRHRRG